MENRRRVTWNIELPPLHPAQLEIAQHPARFKVVDAGRRFGKSSLGVATVVGKAAAGQTAWWVAPTFPISLIGWRLAKAISVAVPGVDIREAEKRIEFQSGGSLTIKSAVDENSLRGEGLDYLVMDEAAFIKEVAWQSSLRPALSDKRGGAMFISTPNGRNWFYELWDKADRHVDPGWEAWKKKTVDNPYIDPDEVEEARKMLPELVFLQEYEAEFVDDAGTVFPGITEAACLSRVSPSEEAEYAFGVDWAKYNDFTVVSVLDIAEGNMVDMHRWSKIDLSWQIKQLKAVNEKWRPRVINLERNQAERVTEELREAGLPINPMFTTLQLKNQMINDLAYAFSSGSLRILQDPELLSELRAFRAERLPSGMFRYGAPSGSHDDCVMSLALAWQAKAQPRGILMELL